MNLNERTIYDLYNELLRKDVQEYEQKTVVERLRRLDLAMQAAVREYVESGECKPKEYVQCIEFFKAMDAYIEENGVPKFGSYDRLKKANAYFTDDPSQFEEFYDNYFQSRQEAWVGVK